MLLYLVSILLVWIYLSMRTQGRWDARVAPLGAGGRLSVSEHAALTGDYHANANATIESWWQLSHSLIARYGEGFCDNCGHGLPRHVGYPAWWLRAVSRRL